MFITRFCGFNVATGACAHDVIPLHWLLGLVCDQSAATVTIIDSSGLTAAIRASAVNPHANTRMWRKCLVLRSESALGKPFIILVSGSAHGSVPPRCLFQQWVGSKTNGFNVDSRMQEADEQTEGNKKSGAQEESWSAERGRERSVYAARWCLLSVNSKELAWASFWDLKLLIFFICERSFCSAWLWPADRQNPFGKGLQRLFGLVLRSSGGRGSLWQLTEEPHNFSNEFRYCGFRSKHLQPSSKFAILAGSCYPATVLHMCASCRMLRLFLKRISSAVLMLIQYC